MCSFLTKSSCFSAGATSRKDGNGSAYAAAAFSGVSTGSGGLSWLITDSARDWPLAEADREATLDDPAGPLVVFCCERGGGFSPTPGVGGLFLLLPPPNFTCDASARSWADRSDRAADTPAPAERSRGRAIEQQRSRRMRALMPSRDRAGREVQSTEGRTGEARAHPGHRDTQLLIVAVNAKRSSGQDKPSCS